MPEKQKQTVTADQAGRVDRVVQQMTGLSRRQLRGLFDHGHVKVNGRTCTDTFARVSAGDRVAIDYEPGRRYAEKRRSWRDPMFQIVFEDDHLLVVNKAAAALTVPAAAGQTNTLIHRVGAYLTARGGKRKRAWACHRLDRGVSGLLVVAKSEVISKQMRAQFETRKPHRRYAAIVSGTLEQKSGTFRSHLATDEELNRYSTPDARRGQLAITHYQVERTLPDATLVTVQLETGRRNQIRVHFAEAGHPVVGDPRYGRRLARHPRWRVTQLALHATELGFMHPVTGEAMKLETPLPGPFQRFMDGYTVGRTSRGPRGNASGRRDRS